VRKALREAIKRAREDEIPDYELARAIHEEEIRLGREMSQGEREAFGVGFHGDVLWDTAFSRAMVLREQ
jgi:hypothetical protein